MIKNFEIDGLSYSIEKIGNYSNKRVKLQVYEFGEDGKQPLITLTHNFPDSKEPEEGYFYAKYWGENREFFRKMIRNRVIDYHPIERESFYFSEKILYRMSPIMVKIL